VREGVDSLEAPINDPKATSATPSAAHVIVLGNEKGGSGKSTTAMHVIVALLKAGRSVASIDTDSRQGSLTRYIDNRKRWARKSGVALAMPEHFSVPLADGEIVSDIEQREYDALAGAVDAIANAVDFVVVDTPAANSYLMKLSHSIADTLVTPLNDSFIDFDVLGRVDPETLDVIETSHYAALVNEARNHRHEVDGIRPNWVVVRNRISTLASRNQRDVMHGLGNLSAVLGFRLADGISERVIFRELFLLGLTVFDGLDRKTLGRAPSMSHLAARREVRELIEALDLPGSGVRPAEPIAVAQALPIVAAPLVVAD
jgi:chromosome partitioning protein